MSDPSLAGRGSLREYVQHKYGCEIARYPSGIIDRDTPEERATTCTCGLAALLVVGEAPQEEDVDITIGGAPWTDEQLAGMRALAHEHDLRNARRLLEDAGYQVVEPGTEVGVGDPGRAAVPSPETVTRLEVIDESGHVLHRRPCQIELSYQDAGRTLKLFVKQRAGVPPLQEPAP